MTSRRHANATTTPEMREFIRNSDLSVAALSRLLKISETTVRKWRKRETIEDASHAPRHLQTTLTPVQEYVVVELRKSLLLSLDDLLQVTHQFVNADVSRAGLARCLKRHGVSRLSGIQENDIEEELAEPAHMTIESLDTHREMTPPVNKLALAEVLQPGKGSADLNVVNVRSNKLPKIRDDQTEQGLFIATDPESGWIYVDIYEDDAADAASRYMSHTLKHAPFHIRRILTGNYHEFMRRYRLIQKHDEHNKKNHKQSLHKNKKAAQSE